MGIDVPFSAADFAVGLAFGLLLLTIAYLRLRHAPDGHVLMLALAFKLLAALTNGAIYIYYYDGVSDALSYHEAGVEYASRIAYQPAEVLAEEPFFGLSGISTDRFERLCGLVHLLLLGSFVASSCLFAVAGFVGQVCLYQFFRERYPAPRLRVWWLVGLLFFPSLVFWSAGMLKDSMGIFGLGLAVHGANRLLERQSVRGGIVGLTGAYLLLLFRPQVLPVLFLAMIPWVLSVLRRPAGAGALLLRRALAVGLIGAGGAGFWLVQDLEARFAVSNLPEAMLRERSNYADIDAGSTLEMAEVTDTSWASLLLMAPGALMTALYRPFILEASGLVAQVGALENLCLLLLTVRALVRALRPGSHSGKAMLDPIFRMCLLFVVIFGVAVGIATPNLGTLSRYRAPLLPFLVGALVIMDYHTGRWGEPRRALRSVARRSLRPVPARVAASRGLACPSQDAQ